MLGDHRKEVDMTRLPQCLYIIEKAQPDEFGHDRNTTLGVGGFGCPDGIVLEPDAMEALEQLDLRQEKSAELFPPRTRQRP